MAKEEVLGRLKYTQGSRGRNHAEKWLLRGNTYLSARWVGRSLSGRLQT